MTWPAAALLAAMCLSPAYSFGRDGADGSAAAPGGEAASPGGAEPGEDQEKSKAAEKSFADRLELAGDLRYRIEIIAKEDEDLRYRHRLRARAGLRANVADGLDALIQLGTGESDDPVSNNQSLTDALSSKPVWLDLAFIRYRPTFADGVELLAGKFKNSFHRVGGSELLWDPDLNPEGLAVAYQPTFDHLSPFVKLAAWFLEERKDADDAWLLGAQMGLSATFGDGLVRMLVGGGCYKLQNLRGQPVLWDEQDSFGNSYAEVLDESGELNHLIYQHGFQLLEGFAELSGEISGFPWSVFGSMVINGSVAAESTGWLLGAGFGRSKQPLDFTLRYIYRRLGRDAVIGLFTDSDFGGGGTNNQGHELNGSLKVLPEATIEASYFYNLTPIDIPDNESNEYHRAQLDFKIEL